MKVVVRQTQQNRGTRLDQTGRRETQLGKWENGIQNTRSQVFAGVLNYASP
jgi:hypothetical protein